MTSPVRSGLLVLSVIVGLAVVGFLWNRPTPVPAVFGERLSVAGGRARAAAVGKPMLVFATADWCGPCQTFKRTTLCDDEVESFIRERFVPVYLNTDTERAFAGSLSIVSIPASIVLVGDRAVGKVEGALGRDAYLAWLKSMARAPNGT